MIDRRWLLPYIAIVLTFVFVVTMGTFYQDLEDVEHQQEIVDATLEDQLVCADSTPQYCQALFERLSENISDEQRERLACTVARYLEVELAPGTVCTDQLKN